MNDILDFSIAESGKMEVQNAPFDLKKLIDEVQQGLADQARAKHLTLAQEWRQSPEVIGQLVGDMDHLRKILTSMMSNAIKFTERGTVTVAAKIGALPGGRADLRVEVRDTGIGIAKANQAKLFDAFSQADNSSTRKFGGTGIGLSLSKSLVELMKGQIGVESDVGQGSTFLVHFAARDNVGRKFAAGHGRGALNQGP